MEFVKTGPLAGYPRHMYNKFKKYHQDNPKVWELFKKFAYDMKNSGREKYSAEIIVNQIRWHYDISSKGDDVFKINNDFKPMYARMLAHKYPKDFGDFFQFRTVRSRGIGSEEERARRGE
jgi:hypothetical protein